MPACRLVTKGDPNFTILRLESHFEFRRRQKEGTIRNSDLNGRHTHMRVVQPHLSADGMGVDLSALGTACQGEQEG
jgi:hypothetical protein